MMVWTNTLNSFHQLQATELDGAARDKIALQYGALLWRVDQHLPDGLDECILQWFTWFGQGLLPKLDSATWEMLEHMLLYLAVQGAVKTTTILTGLVYPAWALASTLEVLTSGQLAYLHAANNLCKRLLLEDDADDIAVAQDLFDIQCIRTRRQAVYFEPHFSQLAGNIPLMIYLESLERFPEDFRSSMSWLRRHLCQDHGFRQGAYRNLNVIREAFETSPFLAGVTYDNLRKEAMGGLRLILWDSSDGKIFTLESRLSLTTH